MLIMIDGIEGGGKSTIVEAWKKNLVEQGKSFFDLKKYCLENGTYPDYQELKPYDFIFSAEPTFFGIGKIIREEMIKNGNNYPEVAIAQAYSLDRLVLYKKIIIPALQDKKVVIEDRGVSTSLCYQSLSGSLSLDWLADLPGNALALEYRPDYLLLIKMTLETAQKRLSTRYEKQDNAIFDKLDFQQKALATYLSPDYQKLFLDRGTKIEYLNTDTEIDIMKAESADLFNTIISK
jgi:thymidylate kinase